MKSIKKAVLVTACFFLSVAVISIVIIEPWWKSTDKEYKDSAVLNNLAGKLDFLIIGASFSEWGLDTKVIDERLGCNCYNLASSSISIEGRYYLLERELKRNPVDTVVFEISYESFNHSYNDVSYGDYVILWRAGSFSERIKFLTSISLDKWLDMYSRLLRDGVTQWGRKLTGKRTENVVSEKGFSPMPHVDVTLPNDQLEQIYNSSDLFRRPDAENEKKLQKINKLLIESGVRIILTVAPNSDALIFRNHEQDEFTEWARALSKEWNAELYDFNLLKARYELFDDRYSFSDEIHLSAEGAEAFTNVFCETIKAVDAGEDVSDRFYDSYEEMKKDSPYMKYITE